MLSISEKFAAGWGIYLIIMASLFMNNPMLLKDILNVMYKRKNSIITGIILMIAGTSHVYFYNNWDTILAFILSFFGWAVLIKGLLLVFTPSLLVLAENVVTSKYINYLLLLFLFLGIYLFNSAYHLQQF